MAIYNGDGTIFLDIGDDPTFTDSQCVEAFIEAMNKKAASIGMASSTFTRPAGDSSGYHTTARDMVLLTMVASSYRQLAEIWSKDSYTCTPRNSGASSVTFTTTVKNTTLEESYPILGGKTGTWHSGVETATIGCICNVNGKQVAGYIQRSDDDNAKRWSAIKQLMDIAADMIAGNANTDTVTDADCAIAILVPPYFTANYEQQTMEILYQQSENTAINPASSTKILTALVVLDWINDITDTFEFKQSDMIGGSGAVFNVGDIVSFKDALYALMLPSSNQSAQAMARVVGRKILMKS